MNSPLKHVTCAWVTPVLGVEGNLLYFGPLLNTLSKHFKRFTVFTGEYKGSPGDADFDIELCGKFKRLYKNERFSNDSGDGYITGISVASPVVLRKLLSHRADLVIINEFSLFSFYAALSRLFSRKTRVLCIVESRPRLNDRPLTSMLRRHFRRVICWLSDGFLTNNAEGRTYLVDELGVNDKKIVARPYLVSDIGRLNKDGHSGRGMPSGDKINFLYVGQLVQRKGLHLAIEACKALASEYPDRFVFNIVGDGPYRSDLEELVTRYGLNSCVVFHGRQKYEDLPAFYANADAFLFPTLSDYRALSPFEALSYGLPIFASVHDGGITETVIEGENGFSFDPRDPAALAQKLKLILEHPESIQVFGAKSAEIAKMYTLPAAVATIVSACMIALCEAEA